MPSLVKNYNALTEEERGYDEVLEIDVMTALQRSIINDKEKDLVDNFEIHTPIDKFWKLYVHSDGNIDKTLSEMMREYSESKVKGIFEGGEVNIMLNFFTEWNELKLLFSTLLLGEDAPLPSNATVQKIIQNNNLVQCLRDDQIDEDMIYNYVSSIHQVVRKNQFIYGGIFSEKIEEVTA